MISQIRLVRFKKFQNTTVELRRLSVLVGENSSGKTSILQAINLAMHAFSRNNLYKTDDNGKTSPRRKGVGCTQLPGIFNDDFRELYYKKKSRTGKNSKQNIGAEIYLFDEDNNKYGVQISSLFGGYNLKPLSKASDLSNNPVLHQKEPLLISGFVGLVSSEEKTLSLALRNRLRDGRASEIIRNLLLDTKQFVPRNFDNLINRLKNDFNFYIDNVDFNESKDITVHAYYDEEINGQKIPFDFCSSGSGMMQVLQILTSIYRYCPNSSSVVLLDEPDAHLHPNLQAALFYSLREIQKELDIQIIISTHSTTIISSAAPSEIIPISPNEHVSPLTRNEDVNDLVLYRLDSYALSKIQISGTLVLFEDDKIDYFIKCDKILRTGCLIGTRTAAYLTGRSKDDRLPFMIRPVIDKILNQKNEIYVIRDRDGLSDDIVEIVKNKASEVGVHYYFLNSYEIESYLLDANVIRRTLEAYNPNKSIPELSTIKEKIEYELKETITRTRYNYNGVLRDNIMKLSHLNGLEEYRSSNITDSKVTEIINKYDDITDYDELRKVGMGKEALKGVLRWINSDLKLKISHSNLIDSLQEEDIPQDIKIFFSDIKRSINKDAFHLT